MDSYVKVVYCFVFLHFSCELQIWVQGVKVCQDALYVRVIRVEYYENIIHVAKVVDDIAFL